MNVQELTEEAAERLAEQERAYEDAFDRSRRIIRKTKTAIHLIHEGKRDAELIDGISGDLATLVESVQAFPDVLCSSPVRDAMMEFSETVLYDYASRGADLPSYADLDVTPAAWVEGLADAIGELRRDMLTFLMGDDLESARRTFSKMEELSDALMTLDVKDSVAHVRRKQDIARGIMERSRSDIATAAVMSRAGKR